MFSEISILIFILMMSSQSSSLWTSLLIIPMSVLTIVSCSSTLFFSGIVNILYVMVFIGGLMVLLVSVASISYQEPSFYLLKVWGLMVLVSVGPLMFSLKNFSLDKNSDFLSWVEESSFILLISGFFILAAMISLTSLSMEFKGMIRNM